MSGLTSADRDIDLAIGELLLAEELHSKDCSDDEKRGAARRWFALQSSRLASALCGNAAVERARAGGGRNALISAVADAIIQTTTGFDVPATLLAVKVVEYGLDKLCGPVPPSPDSPDGL